MTQSLPPSILEALGISDAATLRLVERHEAPGQAVAQGGAAANLTAAVAAVAVWLDVGGVALRHASVPAFVAFHEEDVAAVVAGSPVQDGGRVAFDSDAGAACVRTVDGALYVLHHGTISHYAHADLFADLEVEPAPPSIPASDSVRWAEQLQAEPWLRGAVAHLASHRSGLSDAAAAGLLARLWVPPRGLEVARDQLPRERVRAWIQTASPEQREALEQHAVHRAGELAERVSEVRSESTLRDLIEQRDDLQSVLRVLGLSGRGGALRQALEALDDEAADHLESFANLLPALSEAPDADRWMAVAWQEPDAWWTGAA